MTLDFAAFPPEINSARMYTGPGSGSWAAAAAGWNAIAAEMHAAARNAEAAVAELTGEGWRGQSAETMLAAATPYLSWLDTTAVQVEQVGAQANAAVAAFDTAFALTVPPALVTANRTRFAALVKANIVGQNTPAIAATEAEYSDMWAQDAAAMNGYAVAADRASTLTPLTAPTSTTNPAAAANPAKSAASAATSNSADAYSEITNYISQTQFVTDLNGVLAWLGLSPNTNTSTVGLGGLMNFLDGANNNLIGDFLNNATVANVSNAFTTSGLMNPTGMIDAAVACGDLAAAPATAAAAAPTAAAALSGGVAVAPALVSATVASSTASASAVAGQAGLVGALSVPTGWGAGGARLTTLASTSLLGVSAYRGLDTATQMVVEGPGPMGMPGIPLGGLPAGESEEEANAPVYGFHPRFIARPPAAG